MKRLSFAAVTAGLVATAASAQQTTQQSVVGASGDAVYSVQVVGANGLTYNCLPTLDTVAGQLVRRCLQVNAAGVTPTPNGGLLGGTLGTVPIAAVAAVALIAVVAADGSSTSTTN